MSGQQKYPQRISELFAESYAIYSPFTLQMHPQGNLHCLLVFRVSGFAEWSQRQLPQEAELEARVQCTWVSLVQSK